MTRHKNGRTIDVSKVFREPIYQVFNIADDNTEAPSNVWLPQAGELAGFTIYLENHRGRAAVARRVVGIVVADETLPAKFIKKAREDEVATFTRRTAPRKPNRKLLLDSYAEEFAAVAAADEKLRRLRGVKSPMRMPTGGEPIPAAKKRRAVTPKRRK